jgi:hypothetical protein
MQMLAGCWLKFNMGIAIEYNLWRWDSWDPVCELALFTKRSYRKHPPQAVRI